MRIVYFYSYDGDLQSGVNKKVISQISNLIKLEVHASGIMIRPRVKDVDYQLPKFLAVSYVKELSPNDFFGRLKRARTFSKILAETIDSMSHKDILYYRGPSPVIFFYPIKYIKKFRKCTLVTEHQTIESVEYKLNRNYTAIFFDQIFGKFIRKQSDVIIGVTDEITQYELKQIGNPQKPHITIGNGFDVNTVPLREPRPFDNSNLHLLCVANISLWHGLDRLLKSIAAYNGHIQIIFHIVGEGAELSHLKEMVNTLNIQNNVIFHGFLTGNSLDVIFSQSHIAIGSLGIHRKGLSQTSELKAREYCARGIPYIIACSDPDFPDDYPYICRIPADETPVDITKVIEFAQKIKINPDHPQQMRAYAIEYLDWSVKMKELKAFLENLVDEPGSG